MKHLFQGVFQNTKIFVYKRIANGSNLEKSVGKAKVRLFILSHSMINQDASKLQLIAFASVFCLKAGCFFGYADVWLIVVKAASRNPWSHVGPLYLRVE